MAWLLLTSSRDLIISEGRMSMKSLANMRQPAIFSRSHLLVIGGDSG